MRKLVGSCLCGQVKFAVNENFLYAGYCHCSLCRKASAATGTAIAAVNPNDFTLLEGEGELSCYRRTANTQSHFCQHCGSLVYGNKPEQSLLHFRMALLDDEPSIKPQAHIFVGSKAAWYDINDDLPQFTYAPGA